MNGVSHKTEQDELAKEYGEKNVKYERLTQVRGELLSSCALGLLIPP